MTKLPKDHQARRELNDEAHARPPEALVAPSRISFFALYDEGVERARHVAAMEALCRRFGIEPPPPGTSHFSQDLGPFRIKWEKHTEFTRYKVIVPGGDGDPFKRRAVDSVPRDWLDTIPGSLIAATHVEHLRATRDEKVDIDDLSRRFFDGQTLIGASIAADAALAFTDFRIKSDGFSRLLILDRGLAPRQAGRTVQRLLEIDAYRILAMMALPVARELAPQLSAAERDLADITAGMAGNSDIDEPGLLDRLTRLEAQIQQRLFETAPRFSASEAYYRLIQRRTEELREQRQEGVQTFREFVERRLSPAMGTCQVTSARQEKLSQRVAETTALLSTRVEVSRQRQSQAVLESMNRRALLQLRMQQTVEGLSVAAITYYVVGLVAYVTKGMAGTLVSIKPDIIVAASVPVVALLVTFGVRHVRKLLEPIRGGPDAH